MAVRLSHAVFALLALVLIWGLPAQAETAAAPFCTTSNPEAELALGTPEALPAQTCGPCILEFCAQPGIRCSFTGCGRNNCCAYSCACDLSCTTGGTPGNTCIFQLPENCLCGNQQVDGEEECDPPDFQGQTCVSLGFDSGTLGCTSECLFDRSGCQKCGNGVREGTEQCDLLDLDGQTCESLGFNGGTLACTGSCTFDTSECCGDGTCKGSESCETCPEDCDSKTTGNPMGRFCCGNGIPEAAEGAGCAVCDGNC